jgi:hypothetical protein
MSQPCLSKQRSVSQRAVRQAQDHGPVLRLEWNARQCNEANRCRYREGHVAEVEGQDAA